MRKVDEVLQSRDTYWIDAGNTVREAVRYLCERKTGAVAVKDGDEVVGMFSERDLMHRVINVNRDPDKTLVRDVMSRELIFISGDADVRLAKAKMYQNRVRHLLVVGSGNVFRGLLSMRDLMEADVQEANELIHKMNDEYYESAYQAKWTMVANRVIVQPYVPSSS